ncbi:DUF1846 domain-containing protein [Candidatus Fermentibacteria bacterium]|nr:DUF1846 domain-containing protein [Candidatus Fermentibacteria bacterium]
MFQLSRRCRVQSKGFDNEKYLAAQTAFILERIDRIGGRLYLEFGGKLVHDFHAARVLPGYDPDVKMRLLERLADGAEILLCIYAGDIERRRIRGDFGITYDTDALRLIDELRGHGLVVRGVVVTRFDDQPSATGFINRLERRSVQVFIHRATRGYPTDVELIASEQGYGMNPMIPCGKPLVIVTGPGPGSGKLGTCLSQLYHEHRHGVEAGFAKFETFPVWNLPLEHPVNAAYEAATADLGDFNLIDPFHLEADGTIAINYNRDVEAFPVLRKLLERITGAASLYRSPTEMGVNRIADGITDDDSVRTAAKDEIIRRYFRSKCEYATGIAEAESVRRIEGLMSRYDIEPEHRAVVPPARETARLRAEETSAEATGAALELPDGSVVTGHDSALMHAPAALVINAVKRLAGLPKDLHLLAPGTIASIANLKLMVTGASACSLGLEEMLIALSVSATTNPVAEFAMRELHRLRGCEAHLSHIPAPSDGAGLRKLGINFTSDPLFASGNLAAD